MKITRSELCDCISDHLRKDCEDRQDLLYFATMHIADLLSGDQNAISNWKNVIRAYATKDQNIEIVK